MDRQTDCSEMRERGTTDAQKMPHVSQHTCTFSYTNTQRKGGRGKKVLLFEREIETEKPRETYDFHYTNWGRLNAFSKTWTEKSMPTVSARYPAQLRLTAHSCRHYTT